MVRPKVVFPQPDSPPIAMHTALESLKYSSGKWCNILSEISRYSGLISILSPIIQTNQIKGQILIIQEKLRSINKENKHNLVSKKEIK